MNQILSVCILSTNGLNSPIKRKILLIWIKKEELYVAYFKWKHIERLKAKGWKKITIESKKINECWYGHSNIRQMYYTKELLLKIQSLTFHKNKKSLHQAYSGPKT